MMTFALLDVTAAHGAEQVAFAADDETGLRAIVAIYSTVLGPASAARASTRSLPSMTRWSMCSPGEGHGVQNTPVCGNDLGGAKAVIIGDPRTVRTDALIVEYATLVDRLGGRYLTAEDVGTTQADMDLIRTVTPYVTGVSEFTRRLG